MAEKNNVRHTEVKNAILRFDAWDELKEAIEGNNQPKVNELIENLINALDRTEFVYQKRTFEIREDLLDRLRLYCIQHKYKQKTFINIAIEALLNIGEPKE